MSTRMSADFSTRPATDGKPAFAGRKGIFMQLEIGEIYEGVVKGITQYGAFVEIPGAEGERAQTGMVHISEINEGFVRDIREHLKEGDHVRVKVIAYTPQGKISMSIKQANPASGGKQTAKQGGAEQEHGGEKPPRQRREQQRPRVYEPKRSVPQSEMSFEDKLLYFKQCSEEKICDLKRGSERRGGSRSRR